MIVVMDIGNTNVSTAVYDGENLLALIRAPRPARPNRMWWRQTLKKLCTKAGIAPGEISGASICSVVSSATALPAGLLREMTGRRPLIVRGGLPLGLGISYADPDRLGPDRVCAMLAAKKKFGPPVIVVDCGTAVTFDAVNRRGRHAGGMIAPGLALSAASLSGGTAALPRVRPSIPKRPAGHSTREALTAGVYHSVAGSVRENIGQLKKLTGGKPRVVGTGGDAGLIARAGDLFDLIEPALVLEGALIAHRIMGRRGSARRTRAKRPTVSRRGAKR